MLKNNFYMQVFVENEKKLGQNYKKLKILLVEDEPDLIWLMGLWLTEAGHNITEATSIDEARSACGSSQFDCIFLDLKLRGKSSLAFIDEIRGEPSAKNHRSPIVVCSAYLADNFEDIYADKISTALLKPVKREKLMEVLDSIIHLKL